MRARERAPKLTSMRLRSASSEEWLAAVLEDFEVFLADHAACERKASAAALALATRHRDRPELVSQLIALAVEELDHYRQVWERMRETGVTLQPDERDPYVNALAPFVRHGHQETLLDRLLVNGVIEARGCERFGRIAEALPEGEWKAFYREITRSEARHAGLFLRLAEQEFDSLVARARLPALLELEAEILAQLPPRPALH